MPTNEMISTHLDSTAIRNITLLLKDAMARIAPASQNLTPEERQRYGSINEQNKLLVNKVREYQQRQPELATPDVNWTLFNQHWVTRSGFEEIEELCASIVELCSDPRILHDYSLYQNALLDYDYSKYKANGVSSAAAYTSKVAAIKQFFPNTGGGSTSSDEETEDEEGGSPSA